MYHSKAITRGHNQMTCKSASCTKHTTCDFVQKRKKKEVYCTGTVCLFGNLLFKYSKGSTPRWSRGSVPSSHARGWWFEPRSIRWHANLHHAPNTPHVTLCKKERKKGFIAQMQCVYLVIYFSHTFWLQAQRWHLYPNSAVTFYPIKHGGSDSRNQLHHTANLNFGLMCKKAKHCWALSRTIQFSSADPKQNMITKN